jgi:hypothetical protein
MGNRPHRAIGVSEEEETVMWQKGVLGKNTAFSLQFSLWFYTTLIMGLRGRDEHRSMRFGDLCIKSNPDGCEFLEFTERASKTRDGGMYDDHRETIPKVFCACDTLGHAKCVIELFKEFKRRRPNDYCNKEDPLYVQQKTEDQIARSGSEIWYKHQPLGVGSLGKFLPRACLLAGLPERGNHGVRATTVQRLRTASVPDDKIIQITGHRSTRTLAVYDTDQLSTKEHRSYQGILQGQSDTSVNISGNSENLPVPSTSDSTMGLVPSTTDANNVNDLPLSYADSVATHNQVANKCDGKSMFAGAVFNSCVFNLKFPNQ